MQLTLLHSCTTNLYNFKQSLIQDSLYYLGLLSFTCCCIRFLFQSCVYHKQKLLKNGASRNFERKAFWWTLHRHFTQTLSLIGWAIYILVSSEHSSDSDDVNIRAIKKQKTLLILIWKVDMRLTGAGGCILLCLYWRVVWRQCFTKIRRLYRCVSVHILNAITCKVLMK